MAQCATTALAAAVPGPCVRGARGSVRGLGPVPGVVSFPFPPSRPACPALRVAGRPVQVSLTLPRWYAIPRGLCVPRARSGCPSGSPRVPFACVCARAPAASAPPPPGWCGVRTSRGPGTGRWWGRSTWSVPLRVSCPGPLLRLVCLGGGASGPGSPVPGLGLCAPRGAGPGGGGGGPCAVPPVSAAGGASRAGGRSASFRPSAFPGQATKRVSLASFWSWGAWSPYHSGSCSPALSGRNLCGVLARWRWLACSPRFLWEPAAGMGGRTVLRHLSRAGGGGTIPPASGGGGRRPRGLRAGGGAGGGGSRRGLPAPPPGGDSRLPTLVPLRRTPPRRARAVGVTRPPRGLGDEGRPVDRSPRGPFRPEPPLCPPRVGNGHGGGHGGRGLHTVLVRRRTPPPGLVCAPLRRAGVGSPVGRDPRGSERLGALGRAVCGSSRFPPPASRSLLGEGGRPLGSGGGEGRSCGPLAGGGGAGEGVRGAAPPLPAPASR